MEGPQARSIGLSARSVLRSEQRSAASAAIADALHELPEVRSAARVAGYWPAAHEVDLRQLWGRLHDDGVEVHLPRIDPDRPASMGFVRWHPDAELTENRFGIPEPHGDPLDAGEMDVVVLPCVSVDDRGSRVGMGLGFYDRALEDLARERLGPGPLKRQTLLVGAAFDSQRIRPPATIRREEWDVPLDALVTDDAVVRFAS